MTSYAELRFFYATMGTGKSTLALQLRHQYTERGFEVALLTCGDRAGDRVSSRIGLSAPATPVTPATHLARVFDMLLEEVPVSRVVVDEAQFLTAEQVDHLAEVVDSTGLPIDCFGLLTDFRGELFCGSKRLLEVADRRTESLLEAVCWCGRVASHNARVVNGEVARVGDVVVIGDTDAAAEVRYEVLCRAHHRSGQLAPTSLR